MKNLLVSLFALAAMLMPGMAAAQSYEDVLKGLYFDIRGGGSLLSDADNSDGIVVIESDFDPGYVIDGAIGYAHPSGFRGEIALGYRAQDIDTLTITNDGGLGVALGIGSLNGLATSNFNGDVETFSAMANAFYDIDFGSKFKPFVGVGVGTALISVDLSGLSTQLVDDSDTVFAYQGMAGVSYEFNETVTASLLYNYFATTDPSFTDEAGGPFDSEYASHSIMVGLRISR